MGNRLSKIVTKTGDDGSTGLATGERISKSHLRIEAIGDIDELNSFIGSALTKIGPMTYGYHFLRDLQHRLFDLGAELSLREDRIDQDDVATVEKEIETLNEMLPPLKEFIIPGGSQAAARVHICRAVCRRAERHLFKLAIHEEVNKESLKYLNRLSDFFFVMARVAGSSITPWQPKEKPQS